MATRSFSVVEGEGGDAIREIPGAQALRRGLSLLDIVAAEEARRAGGK